VVIVASEEGLGSIERANEWSLGGTRQGVAIGQRLTTGALTTVTEGFEDGRCETIGIAQGTQ
jgi:hypothetical protein